MNFDDFDAYNISVNFWRTAQIIHPVFLVVDFGLNSFWKNFGHFFSRLTLIFFVSLIRSNCFFLGFLSISNDANDSSIFTHACTRMTLTTVCTALNFSVSPSALVLAFCCSTTHFFLAPIICQFHFSSRAFFCGILLESSYFRVVCGASTRLRLFVILFSVFLVANYICCE